MEDIIINLQLEEDIIYLMPVNLLNKYENNISKINFEFNFQNGFDSIHLVESIMKPIFPEKCIISDGGFGPNFGIPMAETLEFIGDKKFIRKVNKRTKNNNYCSGDNYISCFLSHEWDFNKEQNRSDLEEFQAVKVNDNSILKDFDIYTIKTIIKKNIFY